MENQPHTPRTQKLEEMALIVCFLLVIVLPGLGLMMKTDAAPSEENRQLAPFPPLSLEGDDLTYFPERFNVYFNDHFGFRNTLIRSQALAKVRWLNVSSSADVICGKSGWLFFAGENSVAAYRAAQPFSEDELKQWAHTLENRRRWLAHRHIRYVFTVAPDKHTIYPEYMPEQIERVRDRSRLDQLIAYLKEHTSVEVLDLRPALANAKSRFPTYYQTDTHWNDYGAFVAYQEIARTLRATLPMIAPRGESDYDIQVERSEGKDLTKMLGLSNAFSDTLVRLRPRQPSRVTVDGQPLDRPIIESMDTFATEQSGRPLPRLVMFRDSFANALIPYLAEDFSRAVYVWSDLFDALLLERERPDIVLDEIVERKLMGPPPASDPQIDEPVYEGSHDSATCDWISGWAWDRAHPDAIVRVEIYDGDHLLATLDAGGFRQDLIGAGKGNGYHAFEYATPAQLKDGRPHVITVKAAGADLSLSNTRRTLTCK
jgi:alginate O-acetyltransferase complex protein AlgJ